MAQRAGQLTVGPGQQQADRAEYRAERRRAQFTDAAVHSAGRRRARTGQTRSLAAEGAGLVRMQCGAAAAPRGTRHDRSDRLTDEGASDGGGGGGGGLWNDDRRVNGLWNDDRIATVLPSDERLCKHIVGSTDGVM